MCVRLHLLKSLMDGSCAHVSVAVDHREGGVSKNVPKVIEVAALHDPALRESMSKAMKFHIFSFNSRSRTFLERLEISFDFTPGTLCRNL